MLTILFAATVHASMMIGDAPVHTLTIPRGATVTPVARRPGRTVASWLAASGGSAAINGGYFNHSDGWPVSRVVAGGVALTEPDKNTALAGNPLLAPFLDTILNKRSAWFAGPFGWTVAGWDRPPAGWRNALQAGPALLPAPRLDAEKFVLRDARGRASRDGIGSLTRREREQLERARTALLEKERS
jgi:hypothetical protein